MMVRSYSKQDRSRWPGIGITILGLVMAAYLFAGFMDTNFFGPTTAFEDREIEVSVNRPSGDKQVERVIIEQTFGFSARGRPIEGYVIGSGSDVVLLVASLHGNEMGGAELLYKLVEEFRERPELIPETKRVVIIPISNPDGYINRIDKLNANEINLNRNFSTFDWRPSVVGETSAGIEPFSEPESIVLRDIVEEYGPKLLISYHAKGSFVTPERGDVVGRELATWYAQETGYAFEGDDDVWDIPGTFTKWFFEETGNPGFTVELSTYLGSDWDINRAALINLISSDSFPLR